jgi:hypothetical protein
MVLIALPAVMCFRGPHPHVSGTIEFVFALMPVLLFALVQLCYAEGRARERAERERRGEP